MRLMAVEYVTYLTDTQDFHLKVFHTFIPAPRPVRIWEQP